MLTTVVAIVHGLFGAGLKLPDAAICACCDRAHILARGRRDFVPLRAGHRRAGPGGTYGEGDLDGALLLWERVLVIDPENPQANSYVEYVRMNYERLTTDGNIQDSGPYGIGNDDPE